jgi:DHA2 family multidrug resistance protein
VLAVVAAPIAGTLIAKVDPRRLVFCGLLWLACVMVWRSGMTTAVTYWHVAIPLLALGIGLPFFFVPLTALTLGSVEERETASAAGLMNFIRTLSGAVATSLVTTSWEDKTTYKHAELAGLADSTGEAARNLTGSGMSMDGVRAVLDQVTQGQSVMLATNDIIWMVALAFCVAASAIWLAPRPRRAMDMMQAGH